MFHASGDQPMTEVNRPAEGATYTTTSTAPYPPSATSTLVPGAAPVGATTTTYVTSVDGAYPMTTPMAYPPTTAATGYPAATEAGAGAYYAPGYSGTARSDRTYVTTASGSPGTTLTSQPHGPILVGVRPLDHATDPTLSGHYLHNTRPDTDRASNSSVEDELEHRRHLLHLGPNSTAKYPAVRGVTFRHDIDAEIAERRRLQATTLTGDTLKKPTALWYKLENECLADRTRYPIRFALPMQILNVLAFLASITITILCVTEAFGNSFMDIYDLVFTRFTPHKYMLSVWAVIYFFLSLFIIYQAIPYQRTNLVLFNDIHLLFVLACVLNIIYSIFYVVELYWAAAGVVTGLLVVLMAIYVRIGAGWKKATAPFEYLFVHVPFALWLGWISIETILLWATAARAHGWTGAPWTGQGWSVVFMCMIVFLTLVILIFKRDGVFGLVVANAVIAIAVAQHGFSPVPLTFYIVGGVLALFSVIALIVKFFLWRKECNEREIVIVRS